MPTERRHRATCPLGLVGRQPPSLTEVSTPYAPEPEPLQLPVSVADEKQLDIASRAVTHVLSTAAAWHDALPDTAEGEYVPPGHAHETKVLHAVVAALICALHALSMHDSQDELPL
jgi:hypothetical protein